MIGKERKAVFYTLNFNLRFTSKPKEGETLPAIPAAVTNNSVNLLKKGAFHRAMLSK